MTMGVKNDHIGNNSENVLPAEAKKILHSLASVWGDVDSKALEVIPLSGAMTNEVYQIHWPAEMGDLHRKVLVRLYGEGVDIFFDRDNEIRTFETISKHGQGPRLLGRFRNGRIEEFIHARTLSAPDLRSPEISSLIAARLWDFHGLDIPGSKCIILWDRLRNWLASARRLCSSEEAEEFVLDTLEAEISVLESKLSKEIQLVRFCHNDLQYGNLMMDEDTKSVTIIDYEYSGYNPVAYDIANHFCEMAANYHSENPHILDFGKYPGSEERQKFVCAYLKCSGNETSDLDVEQLVQDSEKYTLASHLFWGIWGIISEHVNDIDFNYIEYARQRFQQYRLRKEQLLGSSTTLSETI